jgi:hypothetical protein
MRPSLQLLLPLSARESRLLRTFAAEGSRARVRASSPEAERIDSATRHLPQASESREARPDSQRSFPADVLARA